MAAVTATKMAGGKQAVGQFWSPAIEVKQKKVTVLAPAPLAKGSSIGLASGQRQRRPKLRNRQERQQALELSPTGQATTGGANARAGGSAALSVLLQQQQPSLSASFSFNSYQDIICSGFASNTFAASDVRQTLGQSSNSCSHDANIAGNNNGAEAPPPQLQQQRQQQAKFRVHSRYRSFGGRLADWMLLATPTSSSSVANQTPKELLKQQSEQQQQRRAHEFVGSTTRQSSNSNTITRDQQQQSQVDVNPAPVFERTNLKSLAQLSSSLSCIRRGLLQRLPTSKKYAKQSEATTMSQTLQSIQSLSLQLNRAASLGRSSSQGEMSTHSPLSGTVGGLAGDTDCQLSSGFALAGNGISNSPANKFSRLVGKKATRVKELLLQNLGKADRTTDELLEVHEENFYKQQSQAIRLQKEFKSYVNSLKGTQEANRSLNSCIQHSTGDYQSARHDLVCENLSQLEHLNEDLMEKLRNQIAASICEYLSQFGELREKISKRRRKLIDYDSSRRVYEATLANVNRKRQLQQQQSDQAHGVSAARSTGFLGSSSGESIIQSATSQLISEARLLKLREQHNYCKVMYETINSELHEELPMVYEKKMKHLLMTLQNYFSLEAQFHSNASKLFATASDVIDELPMSYPAQQRPGRQSASIVSAAGQQQQQNQGEGCGGGGPSSSASVMNSTDVGHLDEYPGANRSKAGASGSSGVGSSRGDSSLESSSSPDASSSGSPTNGDEDEQRPQVEEEEEEEEEELEEEEIEQADEDDDHQHHAEDKTAVCGGHDDDEVINVVGSKVTQCSGKESAGGGSQVAEFLSFCANAAEQQQQQQQVSDGVSLIAEQVQSEGIHYGVEDDNMKVNNQDQSLLIAKVVSGCPQEQADAAGPTDGAGAALQSKLAIRGDLNSEKFLIVPLTGEPEQPTRVVGGVKQQSSSSDEAVLLDVSCLYKVKTSYKYLAEDVDELCFEADEIIQVIEFDENQEQEDGWLMGIREVNGQRGLFPANFTRPI